jgi:hypothetical protein
MTALEHRLRRVEDRLAIGELVSIYGILLDNREYEAVGELYTEGGRFWHHVGPTDIRTRQGIVDFYRQRLARAGPTYHYHHGHVVTFDQSDGATRATGILSAHAELGIEGRMVFVGLRYHDAYVEGDDGRWRFSERENRFHYFMPADEVPKRYCDEIRRTWPGEPLPADVPDMIASYQAEPHAGYPGTS